MMLSILICHLKSRERQLRELLQVLDLRKTDEVEILVETDAGGKSVGAKRNALLDRATGNFVAFVDDDDMVSDAYIPKILAAISSKPDIDCVGIVGKMVGGRWDGWTFRHSVTVQNWCKDKHRHIFFRPPNHLNPVLRQFALLTRFPLSNFGEDRDYSDRIKVMLRKEVFIEDVLYYYKTENK
jgi:glycosyltransferase involved in cell wall biosynthesis